MNSLSRRTLLWAVPLTVGALAACREDAPSPPQPATTLTLPDLGLSIVVPAKATLEPAALTPTGERSGTATGSGSWIVTKGALPTIVAYTTSGPIAPLTNDPINGDHQILASAEDLFEPTNTDRLEVSEAGATVDFGDQTYAEYTNFRTEFRDWYAFCRFDPPLADGSTRLTIAAWRNKGARREWFVEMVRSLRRA